ncbi:MAG: NAD(P)/FAD-dependent oxidoreductase [Alphaproteobacteria bacterium]|nr:NAD(P)/FAD-dependent oxidoreductase [Alphaproteobacteria bacterium]
MHSSTDYTTDVAIIGGGPVGLFAVFELGMLKITSLVIDSLPAVGGQCTALYPEKPIYDIPGFPSVDAADLIARLEQQAAPFQPQYVMGEQVVQCNKIEAGGWQLVTDKGTRIIAKAILIAAGCGAFGPNRPPLSGLAQYEATSVHYMVARREDFRGKDIVIAGGGDSAVDWAVSLAEVAEKIYVVHRRDKFRASPEMVDKMQALAARGKIEMVIPYQLDGLEGANGQLSGVVVRDMDGGTRTLAASHLLAFFGLSMELGPIAGWGLTLAANHITVDRGTMETNIPGIFAIGDIATYDHKLKLILCGFAEAAQAAHAIRDIVYPGVAYHFEYSTSKGVQSAA